MRKMHPKHLLVALLGVAIGITAPACDGESDETPECVKWMTCMAACQNDLLTFGEEDLTVDERIEQCVEECPGATDFYGPDYLLDLTGFESSPESLWDKLDTCLSGQKG